MTPVEGRITRGDLLVVMRQLAIMTSAMELPIEELVFVFHARFMKMAKATWKTDVQLATVIHTRLQSV
jgi:hypothetical protein